MLKMQKENKNRGMSLVEVIISMLVLSIAVVTVLAAFSKASKINLQAKKHQCVESLMENFVEYAESGGTEFADYFGVDVTSGAYTVTEVGSVKTETLKSLRQGYFNFDVEVTTDTAPAKYASTEFNDRPVIQFGGSGSTTVLIDASRSANVSNNNDTDAFNYFYTWHVIAMENEKARIDADDSIAEENKEAEKAMYDPMPFDEVREKVDRELWICAVATGPDKMKLQAYFRYEVLGVDLPVGVDTVYTSLIYVSDEYDKAGGENDLNQVYVLYSEAEYEGNNFRLQDIRILDGATTAEKKLDAIFYIIDQEETLRSLGSSGLLVNNLADRLGGGATKPLNVSFINPDVSPATGGEAQTPQKAEIYCSVNAILNGGDTNVTVMGTNEIVAKGNEIRVVTVTIKVLEQGTGKVLSTKEITRLQ